jgi:hypothetical protein
MLPCGDRRVKISLRVPVRLLSVGAAKRRRKETVSDTFLPAGRRSARQDFVKVDLCRWLSVAARRSGVRRETVQTLFLADPLSGIVPDTFFPVANKLQSSRLHEQYMTPS